MAVAAARARAAAGGAGARAAPRAAAAARVRGGVRGGARARRAAARAYTLFGGEDNETLVAPGGFWNARLGFSAANELFVGRTAMFGHAAAMVYDMNNQGGPISALSGALGITSSDGGEVFISFAVLSLAFGLLPRYEYDSARDRWVWSWTNEPASASKRGTTKGNEGDAVLAGVVTSYQVYVGKLIGLTVDNERFLCRCAMFSFDAMLLAEIATGLGPLGQLSAETGIPVDALQPYAVIAVLSAGLVALKTQFVDKLVGATS